MHKKKQKYSAGELLIENVGGFFDDLPLVEGKGNRRKINLVDPKLLKKAGMDTMQRRIAKLSKDLKKKRAAYAKEEEEGSSSDADFDDSSSSSSSDDFVSVQEEKKEEQSSV